MKKPKHFLLFKIIGFVGVVVAVVGVVLVIVGFGDFETKKFLIGSLMFPLGIFVGVYCLIMGFRPEISKMKTKTIKHIQEENKNDLQDIMTSSAKIASEAVKITTNAINKELQKSMFCKHCGKEIDVDSKFCRYCGGEQ